MRLRVGQQLLDGGPGSVAAVARDILASELRGLTVWPVGEFREIGQLSLEWRRGDAVLNAAGKWLGVRQTLAGGFVLLETKLIFKRVTVPLSISLFPYLENGELRLRAKAKAKVVSDNRLYRFIIRVFDGDRRATEAAEAEISKALVSILEPPPALPLPGGGSIRIAFCEGEQLSFRTRLYGELPLAIIIDEGESPLLLAPPERNEIDALVGAIELELDPNALQVLLYRLWSTGFLDRALTAAKLTESFNTDPDVEALLSVRAHGLKLGSAPVIEPSRRGIDIAAELDVVIEDLELRTNARLFARGTIEASGAENAGLIAAAELREVALTCEPIENNLQACYSTLVRELSARAPQANELLRQWLETSLLELLVDRVLAIDGAPALLEITRPRLREENGRVRVGFDAALVGE